LFSSDEKVFDKTEQAQYFAVLFKRQIFKNFTKNAKNPIKNFYYSEVNPTVAASGFRYHI